MISALVPVETVYVHMENEPAAPVECRAKKDSNGEYLTLRFGNCVVFATYEQALKLWGDIRRCIEDRAAEAEAAAPGSAATFEQSAHDEAVVA